MTKNFRDLSISILAMAVIVFGICYHLMRERLHHADLHAWYQQDNAELFAGKLPDARVEWSDLTAENDAGKTYQLEDGSFVILIDRKQNTSENEARDTVKHEACHLATWGEEPPHGPKWQACPSRFRGKSIEFFLGIRSQRCLVPASSSATFQPPWAQLVVAVTFVGGSGSGGSRDDSNLVARRHALYSVTHLMG